MAVRQGGACGFALYCPQHRAAGSGGIARGARHSHQIVRSFGPVAAIQKLLAATPKGRAKIVLALDLDGGEEAEMELPGAWQLTDAAKASLRQINGIE